MKKVTNLIKVLLTTRTISGWNFQLVYLCMILNRKWAKKFFEGESIYKNNIGIFSANTINDSFSKSLSSFEYHYRDWFLEASTYGTFVDIGANIGFYSLWAAKYYTGVVAFEPVLDTYQRLNRNILNTGVKVETHNVALGEKEETAEIQMGVDHTGSSSLLNSVENYKTEVVSVKTLDSYNLNPSFIKIDVEGYEYFVLKGASKTLKSMEKGSCVFIEIAPSSDYASQTKDMLKEAGFVLVRQRAKNYLYKKS